MSTTELLDDLWRQQSIWSRTANQLKKRIGRARVAALADTVTVAVLGALATIVANLEPTVSRVLAGVAAFGASLLPVLRPAWSGRALQDWTRARSVSEGLKSEVYLWLARVGDYHDDVSGRRLREKAERVRSDAADLVRHQARIVAEQRDLPLVHDIHSYFAVRVSSQIGYYRARAGQLNKKLRWFRTAEVALAVLGAAIAAVAAADNGSTFTGWIAVITTIGTALAVHRAATRYEYQLIEYLRTADRLEQLQGRVAGTTSTKHLEELAQSAEAVISVENQGWMAKLSKDSPEHRAPKSGK
ncbi:DUF4231 domain-containing protein [Streptomyces incarnatus]|uniref:DUF4231 domain-containing protein n=1 Tax=Streptomyces incarnatus TaxID=665007 RepID=UPI001AD846ED|nr:DUF4231 domain-containing protein [Streptomyces incarnatus]